MVSEEQWSSLAGRPAARGRQGCGSGKPQAESKQEAGRCCELSKPTSLQATPSKPLQTAPLTGTQYWPLWGTFLIQSTTPYHSFPLSPTCLRGMHLPRHVHTSNYSSSSCGNRFWIPVWHGGPPAVPALGARRQKLPRLSCHLGLLNQQAGGSARQPVSKYRQHRSNDLPLRVYTVPIVI